MREDILDLIGRSETLFSEDLAAIDNVLIDEITRSSFLVLGGAGSIGQAVCKEIFKRNPKKLHVVDLSENNLVELVRDIRSSYGYISGEFDTFALDIGSLEYDMFFQNNEGYDYVLNLSALKHVRSEKDPYTLMRMMEVNVFNTEKTIQQCISSGVKKYFCVSTDKAANPVNMMGASKSIMEMFVLESSKKMNISMARFANVAFSDGSLLHGFDQRLLKGQPIVAPSDVKRYFVTPQESGELCLLSCILGENRDIFFPKLSEKLHLMTFSDIAMKYLSGRGYKPHICEDEESARQLMKGLPSRGEWPCLFSKSDTTGEKSFEEFFTAEESLDLNRFKSLGVIQCVESDDLEKINFFRSFYENMKKKTVWKKEDIVEAFCVMLPEFNHLETGKYLNSKM